MQESCLFCIDSPVQIFFRVQGLKAPVPLALQKTMIQRLQPQIDQPARYTIHANPNQLVTSLFQKTSLTSNTSHNT
jgi:hypothetical protein